MFWVDLHLVGCNHITIRQLKDFTGVEEETALSKLYGEKTERHSGRWHWRNNPSHPHMQLISHVMLYVAGLCPHGTDRALFNCILFYAEGYSDSLSALMDHSALQEATSCSSLINVFKVVIGAALSRKQHRLLLSLCGLLLLIGFFLFFLVI